MQKRIYQLFAELLDYPGPHLAELLREGISVLEHPEGADLLRGFAGFLDRTPPGQVEEIYTRTFDLQPLCAPYIGCQLLGEDRRRALFLSRLQAHYLACGFSRGKELPDHLGVILRFLAFNGGGKGAEELVRECLIPALAKMVAALSDEASPYHGILRALLLQLQDDQEGGPEKRGLR